MPQLAPVVLKDGASTPANHTFAPRDITSGVATLVETTGVPIADRRMTLGLSRTDNGRVKATIKFVIPVVQDAVVNGVARPTVTRTAYADIVFSFDGASSLQERKDALAFACSMLNGQTLTNGLVVDLQGIY